MRSQTRIAQQTRYREIDSHTAKAFEYKFNRDIYFIRPIRIVQTKIDSARNDSLMTKQMFSRTTQRTLCWKRLIENISSPLFSASNVRKITI